MELRTTSLLRTTLARFAVCTALLLLVAAPLFYWLTKSFYAEDMIDIIESVEAGQPLPKLDLEQDIMAGMMLQYFLFAVITGSAVVLTARIVSKRIWRPFYDMLAAVDSFRIESGICPPLPDSRIREFAELKDALGRLMEGSASSYKVQKEFSENASHELQTPLAVMRGKLDLLSQLPEITGRQAAMIQELYQISGRMSRLNRNLLLLAKMDNSQFDSTEEVDAVEVVRGLLPYLESLVGGLKLTADLRVDTLPLRANRSLMESMAANLVVNAVRHNREGGEVVVRLCAGSFSVENTSCSGELDAGRIFERFYRPSDNPKGNGLGLAIVKAVCDYHGWGVEYAYSEGRHRFTVKFA